MTLASEIEKKAKRLEIEAFRASDTGDNDKAFRLLEEAAFALNLAKLMRVSR